MTAVYVDAPLDDATRRRSLYDGDIHILSPRSESLALVEWARSLIEQAFAPHDPRLAQYEMGVHQFVDVFAPLKPRFIHNARTKQLLRELFLALRCDQDTTYADVPRLRGVTSDGYLTAGVGFAHPMHRDTWWSAPLQQLNWWMPLYPIESNSSMAFHPAHWASGVANTSRDFDYYEWNRVGRAEAAQHVTSDTREQPHIVADPPPSPEPQLRFVVPPGGIVLFSGQHLHSTVANTTGLTRFSIDVRTVNVADVRDGVSAINADSAPVGTSLRDFRRLRDGDAMPEELARMLDPRDVDAASVVFTPDLAASD